MTIAAWIVGPFVAYLAGVGLTKEVGGYSNYDQPIPWFWPLAAPIWLGSLPAKAVRALRKKDRLPRARAMLP